MDGAVDAWGEAEVVRVEDESGRHGGDRNSKREAECDDAEGAVGWLCSS